MLSAKDNNMIEIDFTRWGCAICGFTYDPQRERTLDRNGNYEYIPFTKLDHNWKCPQCNHCLDSYRKI